MISPLEIWREKLNDKAREAMNLLGLVNEIDKSIENLQKKKDKLNQEVTELYEKIDNALDKH